MSDVAVRYASGENDRTDTDVKVDDCGESVKALLHPRRHVVIRWIAEPDGEYSIILLDRQGVRNKVACAGCHISRRRSAVLHGGALHTEVDCSVIGRHGGLDDVAGA